MDHFFNAGYGWTCRRCHEEHEARDPVDGSRARFFREGEAEESAPRLSSHALARWADPAARSTLRCPHCGLEEKLPA